MSKRHEDKQAYVVPVILRPFDWFDAPFAKLQAFPKDAKPVTTWQNQDEAFVSVTQGIRTAAKLMLDYRKQQAEQKKVIRTQYLQKVEEVLSDGVISIVERDTLDELRETLGLTPEEAKEIETLAYEPYSRYEESLKKYKQTLKKLIEKGYYPFSEEIEKDLENRQRDLGIKVEDVARISQLILDQAELDYQAKQKQQDEAQQLESLKQHQQREREEYEAKLERYQQGFTKAVEAEYPLNQFVVDGLKNFQQQLELKDEDVTRIEQPIRKAAEAKYREQLRKREEAERQQQAEAQERRRQEEDRKRQQEVQYREQLKQQQEAERQRQIELEEQRKQAGTSQVSSSQNNAGTKLQRFEFDVITVDKQGNENSRIRKTAEFFAEDLGNGVLLEMVKIPGGTYLMGSPAGQGNDDERPQHSVTLSSFCMGKYPITQAQWLAVAALPHVEIPLNREPSKFKGESRPVEQVSWHEAVEFCQRLSRLTKHQYRLPSEAEWEYACRAGTTTPFYFGETLDENLANYGQNIGETTTVDKYPPNAFGLYDMHGNVFEWCADCWHGNYADAPTDGSAWIIGGNAEYRVLRGGSWNYNPADCRSAYRSYVAPANRDSLFGFRVFCAVLPGLF